MFDDVSAIGAEKKFSLVDFAVMTYDMNIAERESLMKLYNISPSDIASITHVADGIANLMHYEHVSDNPTFDDQDNLNPAKEILDEI